MAGHTVEAVRTYVTVWAVLACLTGATWGIANIDLGVFNIVVALIIAGTKMMLVAYFFMHVKFDDALTRLFAAAGLFWMTIMIVLTLGDYNARGWLPFTGAWGSIAH
jgi:cytochrome c oxidase subunit 4